VTSKNKPNGRSGGDDAFDRAAKSEPPPIKSRFVSTGTVAVGEGVKFELSAAEVIPDPYNDGAKIIEGKGQVIESRAQGLVDEGEITVSCRAARLEQFGNDVMERGVPGSVITLIRGVDENKRAGWRWEIAPPEEGA
jgi:hypothetical protein